MTSTNVLSPLMAHQTFEIVCVGFGEYVDTAACEHGRKAEPFTTGFCHSS